MHCNEWGQYSNECENALFHFKTPGNKHRKRTRDPVARLLRLIYLLSVPADSIR
jgi:hypothetical protein